MVTAPQTARVDMAKKRGASFERDFLARLSAALEVGGTNQAELARRLGTTQSTISEWFNRRSLPKAGIVARIPKALGVSGHWLLTGEGPMIPESANLPAEQVQRTAYAIGVFRALAQIELLVQEAKGEAQSLLTSGSPPWSP